MVLQIDKIKTIEELLYIDNKEGIVVPFSGNRMQRYYQKHKTNRNIVLKHRQGGFSSFILADMFIDCITVPHSICAVVSHEGRATQRLLDRVHFYYKAMDEPKPQTGAESRSEITFPELHSSIYIGTAGSRAFGRGDTIRKALLSELAHYEDGERILTGVEDAVPLTGELIIECSPLGEDNVFYSRWVKAREGRSPYKPFFFPWWWTEEYQIPRDPPSYINILPEDRGELTYTGEELELIERHAPPCKYCPSECGEHFTEAQIRWRRWKIAEKGGLFFQEFPEDEVSCFLTVGDPVFDPYILTSLAQNCYEGEYHTQGWTFWKPPEEKMRYTIGADTSAGAPGGSYSAAIVLNDRWEVCATFMGRLEPHVFAGILKELGIWYNRAEIAVERNFTGYAVLGHMKDYPNLYHQRDFVTGKVTTQIGWWTNDQTKEYMRTRLKDKLPQLKLWDVNLVRQMRGYRYIKFRPTAQTFDDLVIALMIAVAVKSVSGGSYGYQGSYDNWGW